MPAHHSQAIAQGSSTVWFDGRPAAREGDKSQCGASIASGSLNVVIGGRTETYLWISPELPPLAYRLMFLSIVVPTFWFMGPVAGSASVVVLTLDKDMRRGVFGDLTFVSTINEKMLHGPRTYDTLLEAGVVATWELRPTPALDGLAAKVHPSLSSALEEHFGQSITDRAINFSTDSYPSVEDATGVDVNYDKREAARHLYWMALLTYEFDEEVAKAVGDAHELGMIEHPDSTRDLYNNAIGRTIGLQVKAQGLDSADSVARIQELVLEAVESEHAMTNDHELLSGSKPRCS